MLRDFVMESWRIERLDASDRIETLVEWHRTFCEIDVLETQHLVEAALVFTDGKGRLRSKEGMNVRIGSHYPPPGGPLVEMALSNLLNAIEWLHPYEAHHRYESLHPFLDGNGRTGRMLWLWGMRRQSRDWSRGFLHEWYYQSLDHGRLGRTRSNQ